MGSAPNIALSQESLELAGTVIAERYRLESPIGTGGMATVWRATHLVLNQPIALKFIQVVGIDATRMRDRFLREARVAAAIRHRNVVEILDFGTSKDGQPYMAMELLEGESLAERMMRDPPMTLAETVRMMARVLSGLGAVHDAGIIHRDLKPENIELVEDADGIYPKLIDFGVSRALDNQKGIKSVLLTVENAIVGTPQYMSPEQARGLPGLDHRSDIWSAGVILYELLTGRLPYDGEASGDVIIKIATEDPPEFAELRPDLAGAIEAVIKCAMHKKPEARFENARDMRAELLAAAAQTATKLHAASSFDRFQPDTNEEIGVKDLLDAVGDAYEPGDSGVLDFSDHLQLLESFRPPAIPGVPPVAPRLSEDPFETRDEHAPKSSSRTMLIAAIIGAMSIVALLLVALVVLDPAEDVEPTAPEAEAAEPADPPAAPAEPVVEAPPPAVHVVLSGVPEGGEILIDGVAWTEGATLEIDGDGAAHAIEVRAEDGRSWRTSHMATADGEYEVELPAPPTKRRWTPRRRRRGGAAQSQGRRGGSLIRTPTF